MLEVQLKELREMADDMEVALKEFKLKLYTYEADHTLKMDVMVVSEDLAHLVSDVEELVPDV